MSNRPARDTTRGGDREPSRGEDGQGLRNLLALTSASADVTAVLTLDGVYRYASPACHRLFGWTPLDLLDRRQEELVHPDDVASVRAAANPASSDDVSVATFRVRCSDGSYRWTETTSRRVEARGSTLVVQTMRDITERRKSALLLEHRAMTDPLTGVANRTVLMDRLHQALRRLSRGKGILAVLVLDLDRFKLINDSLGHRIGDRVLLDMAERLLRFLRTSDTLARLGGDEFAVIGEDMANEEAAIRLGQRIAEAGRQPFRIGAEEFVCTVSVGIATTADTNHGAEALLQEADLALYRAKDRGRDRAEVFDEELRTSAVGRLSTERMLRRAIPEQRLRVHYQPIIDLRSDHAVAAEALVRIWDPDLGLLQPEAFLEVAEETGLLVTIDEFVFGDALRHAADWHARFPASQFSAVAVNVTTRHLADSGFAQEITDALDARGLPRHYLQVEVTERVLIEASRSAMTGLRAIQDSGIQVGLDDFGTGYSSLSYLREFPLDFVKIDRSFIHGLAISSRDAAIVRAIIDLSHALGLVVVAEGVETEGQLAALKAVDCDRAQGFLLAPPRELATLDELMVAGVQPSRLW